MVTRGRDPTNTENANRKRHRWEQQRICTYECQQLTEQDVTTHGGREVDTNESEQGGEQMPIPACCLAQKGENRSEVLQDALGAFHEQREPPRNLHRYAMEQKTEKQEARGELRIGSAALPPLRAR